MPRRPQPELERSEPTASDPDPTGEVVEKLPRGGQGGLGPVPPENRPGHHGPDQDKPHRPPPQPTSTTEPAAGSGAGTQRFPFQFDPRLLPLAAAAGVLPPTAHVSIDDGDLSIRFGPWSLRTTLTNVSSTSETGPYQWWKIAGPPHLSLADRGITFATTAERGLCISFHQPVPVHLPLRLRLPLLHHPAATVTVAAPHALAEALGS
jgi:hypothetical protein